MRHTISEGTLWSGTGGNSPAEDPAGSPGAPPIRRTAPAQVLAFACREAQAGSGGSRAEEGGLRPEQPGTPARSPSLPADQSRTAAAAATYQGTELDRSMSTPVDQSGNSLRAAVAEAIEGARREKQNLADADHECRKEVVRHNAGHNKTVTKVLLDKAEAGWVASRACQESLDRIKDLVSWPSMPDKLMSKLLATNDSLASQLRRWHSLISNPIVQAALAGPVSPNENEGDACTGHRSRSPPRSMHLLDLPGVYRVPAKPRTAMATAPNSPAHPSESNSLHSLTPAPTATAGLQGSFWPSSSGPHVAGPGRKYRLVSHKRSISSPESPAASQVLENFDPQQALRAEAHGQIPSSMEGHPAMAHRKAMHFAEASPAALPSPSPLKYTAATADAAPLQHNHSSATATSLSAPPSVSDLPFKPPSLPGSIRTSHSKGEPRRQPSQDGATPMSASSWWSTATTPRTRSPNSDQSPESNNPAMPLRGYATGQSHLPDNHRLQAGRSSGEGASLVASDGAPFAWDHSSSAARPAPGAAEDEIQRLLDELAEAWQVKATAQKELALQFKARVAAEREAAELQRRLLVERAESDRQIMALKEELERVKRGG